MTTKRKAAAKKTANPPKMKKAWEYMQDELREALAEYDFTPTSLVSEFVTMFQSGETRPADKIRIGELLSKWGGLNAPEKIDITKKEVVIGLDEHDI
jgi:hypothetical protein